jgi:glycosyltransferase involved in cell wall biosynthesis
VSDYSEELLPYLAEKADVDLVTDEYELANRDIAGKFRVRSAKEFLAHADDYDMPIYQIANSVHHHGYMVPCMLAKPGLTVFHDYYLHFLMLGLTVMRGDFAALHTILRATYGSGARRRAYGLLLSTADPYNVTLVKPLIESSRVIITHSECARRLILDDQPDKPVRVVPMGMPENEFIDRREDIRVKHRFQPDDIVVASVTTLSHTKRLEVVLKALAKLKDAHPNLRLLVLGGGRPGDPAYKLIERYDLTSRVRFTGWLAGSEYAQLLVSADCVIDMRYPSGAETSASLFRAIAAGRPAIVSDQGSFVELPDELALKVPVGPGEEDRLSEAIRKVATDQKRRASMSRSALEYAKTTMRLDRAAGSYIDAVQEALSCPVSKPAEFMSRPAALKRVAWSSVYQVSRAVFLYRKYGWEDTVRRFRSDSRVGSPLPKETVT